MTKRPCSDFSTYKKCNYYIRQHPSDKEVYNGKFQKTLEEALKNRDLFGNLIKKDVEMGIDYSKTIFENVRDCLEKIGYPTLELKVRKNVTEDLLRGDVLSNLTSHLYEMVVIKILRFSKRENSLMIERNGEVIKYFLDIPIESFTEGYKRSKNKTQYLEKHIKADLFL